MASFLKQYGAALVAAVTVWGVAVSPAFAQRPGLAGRSRSATVVPAGGAPASAPPSGLTSLPNSQSLVNPYYRIAPNLPLNQAAYNIKVLGHAYSHVPPWLYGYNPYVDTAYYGYSPYGYPGGGGGSPGSSGDSAGIDLQGAASVITAMGDYQVKTELAGLGHQQVEQAKVHTRHTIFDEWQYERANTPTIRDRAEQAQAREVRRVLHDPGLPDILSGHALNTLLQDLYTRQSGSVVGPATLIDQQLLKQVNLTAPGGSSTGALKGVFDGGTLDWPLPLRATSYQDETRRLDRGVAQAIRQIPDQGSIDPGALEDLLAEVRRLRDELRGHPDGRTLSEDIKARRFLNQLEDALRALQDPDAVGRLRGDPATRGRTVPELLRFMAQGGLVFAPAAEGQEAAYVALYSSLANYRNGLRPSAPPE